MVRYIWHEGEAVPDTLENRQVHGVLLMPDGRVLLRIKDGTPRLTTGGRPDPEDASPEATLRREVLEEINCEVSHLHYIGYQTGIEDNGEQFAQMRYVALVDKIGPARPDVDAPERTYGRELKSPEETAKSFPPGDLDKMLNTAIRVAREYNLCDFSNKTHVIINEEVNKSL